VFAIPFTNRRDYERAEDAFSDMGCLTAAYVPVAETPFHPTCRSVERLLADQGDCSELYVLQVAVPSRLMPPGNTLVAERH
jgi:hypothetical protein